MPKPGGGGGEVESGAREIKQTATEENGKIQNQSAYCYPDVQVPKLTNFITQMIDEEIASGLLPSGGVVTRFPPEPNGWLHLGHAKSICLNFGLAVQYGGRCHLRFDDTNPAAEEEEYIEGIKRDVDWLGFRWNEHLYFASDYFQQMYDWAEKLILKDLAYVDEQTDEEVRVNRGTILEPGKNSRFRDRPVEESLKIFRRMKNGELEDGSAILRAKIDMSSGNMNLRDPPIYRIKRSAHHPRTGDDWKIYPIYDFAHGQEDSIEKITHSICTLEFTEHRPLYDWFQEKLEIFKTKQIEFARFNLTYTVMSKRRLLTLVREKLVNGWDDPRMPTLAGCRRRGYTPRAVRNFAYSVGVAKRENLIPIEKLEATVREDLHNISHRRLAVKQPLKCTILNYEGNESVELRNHPEDEKMGSRFVEFGKVIYVDRCDFSLEPPAGWHRLRVGGEVRLRNSYWMKCLEAKFDEEKNVTELICEIDHSTRGGCKPANPRTVKGVIQWVSENDSVPVELRVYDRLFKTVDPDDGGRDWRENLNPESLIVYKDALIEKNIRESRIGDHFQLERIGFFVIDEDSAVAEAASGGSPDAAGACLLERIVMNLTVSLQDTFAGQTDEKSKEAQAKAEQKLAREKAAEERRLIKLAREERAAAKKKAAAS